MCKWGLKLRREVGLKGKLQASPPKEWDACMKNHKDEWQKHILKLQINMVQMEDEEKFPGDIG